MKKTKLLKQTSEPNVYEILVRDKNEKWIAPPLGIYRFRAYGYEREPDGELKRVGRYFRSFAEAKVYALNNCKKKQKFVPPPVAPRGPNGGMTFGELANTWEQLFLPNKDTSTQIRYRSYLKKFIFFWNMPVEGIEPSTIDRWIAFVKSPEQLALGHSTRVNFKHEFSVLKGILNFYASRFHRNYRQPFLKEHVGMLKVKEKKFVLKDLSVEEVQAFLKALREICAEFDCEVVYYIAAMHYAVYARIQEVAALHYEDFDFTRDRLSMNRKIQWLRAKGFKDRLVDGAKANGGKTIKMPGFAAKVFREWVMKSGVRNGLLFTMNDHFLTYRQIEYRYTQALKRAGLPYSATHIVRHASLTEHYALGGDIQATAKVAGHRDQRSKMKYAKVRDEKLTVIQEKMDQRLSSLEL